MARDHVRGEQPDDGGEWRRQGRNFDGGKEAVPRGAAEKEPARTPFDAESGGEMGERHRHVAPTHILDEAPGQDNGVACEREGDPRRGDTECTEPEAARQWRRDPAVAL